MNTFRIDRHSLEEMLKKVKIGEIQLPDFQRGWRWDDEHIRSLLASVSRAFPIGTVMTLANGGSVRFKPRPLGGTPPAILNVIPDTLILDGQQRLTALFQSLMSGKAVSTKATRMRRWYYLDMHECVTDESNREEAVISVPEDRILRKFKGKDVLDLSTPENEYANDMFPVSQIFDPDEWIWGYREFWLTRGQASTKRVLYQNFKHQVIKNFEQYSVPVTELDKDIPREAVCLIFEKVNRQGVALNVFELLTASLAAEGFQLREHWKRTSTQLKKFSAVLSKLKEVDFLKVVTLLTTNANPGTPAASCNNAAILQLDVKTYRDWAGKAEKGFRKAARFLNEQNVFDAKNVPYPAQLVPLSAILAHLDDLSVPNLPGVREKLARWYWCGVFGELYGSSADTRFANDLSEVTAWLNGEAGEPATIQDATFQAHRLETLRTRASAAYKGVYALLMGTGCRDFRTGETIKIQADFADNIELHHIFPRAWCEREGIEKDVYNSIINKTPISERTNAKIRDKAPSVYLQKIQDEEKDLFDFFVLKEVPDSTDIDERVRSHLIWADALREDDFELFFEERKEELLKAIEKSMGKPVIRDEGDDSDASS